MRLVMMWVLWFVVAVGNGFAQQEKQTDKRAGCDSCLITMLPESTQFFKPTPLQGTWLFTRIDDFGNSDPVADTASWDLVKTPGPWPALTAEQSKKLQDEGKSPRVGWYRGVIQFQPEQVAKEYVLMLPARLSRVEVYFDGNEVFRRPQNFAVERYFAHQPVPIIFRPKTSQMMVAIKFESVTTDGILEEPFEIRRYNSLDNSLTWHQFRGGELRLMIAWGGFAFSLFFFVVFAKIRQPLYLVAALGSLTAAPYLAIPTDVMLRTFEPESMAFLQSAGLICVFFFFLFCQYFDKPHPKLNWLLAAVLVLASAPALYWATVPYEALDNKVDFVLFSMLRRVIFFTNLTMVAISLYHLVRGVMAKREGAVVLLLSMAAFAVITAHDALMVLGMIQDVGWVPFDTMIFLGAMIYVASTSFARTFKDNERLVTDLKGINDNLEHMVAERTEQLHEKTVDIQAMLQNMRQGILMIQPNGLVHPEYSRFLEQILETKDIAGKAALPLILDGVALGSDAQDSFETAVASCIGEDSMNFSFNGHLLITECDKRMPDGRIKALNLGWSPICSDDDVVDKLMVVIRDVTELRRLEAEAGQQKRELEMIGQILTVNQEKFHEFVDSARGFVKENEALLHAADERHPDLISQLFRNMHTIKGNARTYGLLHLTNLVHEAEQTYDELRHDPDKEFDKQTLMSHLKDVLTSIEEYASLNEIKLGRKGPGRRGSAERYVMAEKMHIDAMLVALIQAETAQDADSLRAALKQAQLGLQVIGTEPIQSVLDGVFASLPSLAKELDKEPPQLVVRDHGIVIRNQIADLLRNVFVHLYRNSLDHGIERPAERASQGKPAFGMIELALELTHGRLIFRLRDDGRGLALKFIRQKAVEKGLIDEKSDMPDDAVAQLIFASGFSTADAVTEVSGRGVGMDAVKDFVQREGGTIVLSFTDEKAGADFRAFETVISMPEHFAVATH